MNFVLPFITGITRLCSILHIVVLPIKVYLLTNLQGYIVKEINFNIDNLIGDWISWEN